MKYIECPAIRRSLSLVVFVSILFSETSTFAAAPLKVMSFNIRFDGGVPSSDANAWISTSGTHRRDLALNTIHAVNPDILGVQEALNNQVLDIQGDLSDYDFYGVGRSDGVASGEYSGLFFRSSRFTQVKQGTFWLNAEPDTPGSKFPGTCCARIASWVVLKDNLAENQEYFVLNTHWDHRIQAARDFSARLIRDRIDLLSRNRPVIVMGDMNATPTNVAYLDLLGVNEPSGLQLVDSYREVIPTQTAQERTSHGFTGNTLGDRIDYLLHSDYFHAEQASIDQTDYAGSYPSDHYPITATLSPRLYGDFDFDGDVDGSDFLKWQRGETDSPSTASNLSDWEAGFGTIETLTFAAAVTVPEPMAWSMVLIGLVASLGIRDRGISCHYRKELVHHNKHAH